MRRAPRFAREKIISACLAVFALVNMDARGQSGPAAFDRYYRVVRCSPEEFASAMRAPFVPPSQIPDSAHAGRLVKLFPVVRKSITGDLIRLDIRPQVEVSFLDAHIPLVILELQEKSPAPTARARAYRAAFRFGDNYVSGDLTVSPTVEGSVLEFSVQKSSYSKVVLEGFAKAAIALNLVQDHAP